LHDVPLQTLITPHSRRLGTSSSTHPTPWNRRRPHRRRPLEWLIKYSPVWYGYSAAILTVAVAAAAAPVSPFCIGVVIDGILADLKISRPLASALYAASLVLAAPGILLQMQTLRLVPRRLLMLVAGERQPPPPYPISRLTALFMTYT
jgi:hypothetical protein